LIPATPNLEYGETHGCQGFVYEITFIIYEDTWKIRHASEGEGNLENERNKPTRVRRNVRGEG
jgi:hypothetical protein